MEAKKEGAVKGNYVSIHSSGFRDFLLKPEILRSIVDCGFEHPSEVQHECIPQVCDIVIDQLLHGVPKIMLISCWNWLYIGDRQNFGTHCTLLCIPGFSLIILFSGSILLGQLV